MTLDHQTYTSFSLVSEHIENFSILAKIEDIIWSRLMVQIFKLWAGPSYTAIWHYTPVNKESYLWPKQFTFRIGFFSLLPQVFNDLIFYLVHFWIFRRSSYFCGEASCVGTHTQSGRSKEKSLQCVWFLKMDRFWDFKIFSSKSDLISPFAASV